MVKLTTIMMIALVGPAHQGWMWTQHNWRNRFWKNYKSQLKICVSVTLNFFHHNYKQYFHMKISHLQWFKEGDEFLESIVMDNETPVYHFPPRIKQAGMRSEHPNSPRSRQFKGCHSAEKDMHPYSGVQNESSTLNSCLGAQDSRRKSTATH